MPLWLRILGLSSASNRNGAGYWVACPFHLFLIYWSVRSNMRHRITEEEKAVIKLNNILSDLRLDLELVGRYLAKISPTVVYNRLITIAESAHYEKEESHNEYKY
jgi:hypothetical protein